MFGLSLLGLLAGWRQPLPAPTMVPPSQIAGPAYRGPNRIGPYRINPNTPLKELFRILGQPAHPGADYYCYRNGGAFLWVEPKAHFSRLAGEMLISSFPNCRGEPVAVTSARIGSWRTGQDIGLGSSEAAVLRVYGSPGYRGSIRGNDPAIMRTRIGYPTPPDGLTYGQWIYSSPLDLRGAKFGLAHGRVVFIFIGNNE